MFNTKNFFSACLVWVSCLSSLFSIAQNINPKNDKELKLFFEAAVQSVDRVPDSALFYMQVIKKYPAESATKEYYYHYLKYMHVFKVGNMDSMIYVVKDLSKWAYETGDSGYIVDANTSIALTFNEKGIPDSASYYFDQALNTAKNIGDNKRIYNVILNYSNLLIKRGFKDDVLEYVHQCIQYDSLFGGNRSKAQNYHLLGNIYLYLADFPAALQAFQIAYDQFELEGRTDKMLKVLNNIGIVHTAAGNYEMAEQSYLELVEIADKHNLERNKISILINFGALYMDMGQIEKNKELLMEALRISEKYNDTRFKAEIINNLGNVAYYTGDYELALSYFTDAVSVNQQSGNKHQEALCHANRGWALLVLNRKNECFDAFNTALNLASKIGASETRMDAFEGLADASEYFGDYKSALAYRDKYEAVKDSIVGARAKNKIAELQTLYEKEKKENQIKNLQQEKEFDQLKLQEKNLEISKLNWQRFGLILFVFIVLLGSFLLYRIYQSKKEVEKNKAIIAEREKGLQAVFDATEEERQRISKDLHDGVGQQMSGLKLAWQNMIVSFQNLSDEEKNKLESLSKILDETASDVRTISHRMMPRVLSEYGLVEALQDMLEKSFALGNIAYNFEHFNITDRLPKKIEIALFRIAQELTNNIIKHSKADQVNVQLFKNNNQVVLVFEDNGIGVDISQKNSGHGFINIQSRLSGVNGQFNLEPSYQKGSVATIRIQL